MADSQFHGLIGNLSASFEAQAARAENVAAADLARALQQDADLEEAIARWRGARLAVPDLPSLEIVEVGSDYVAAGEPVAVLVPRRRLMLMPALSGARPRKRTTTFCLALRSWSRAGNRVVVKTYAGTTEGALARVGLDHVLLRSSSQEVLIAFGAIQWIRLSPGD